MKAAATPPQHRDPTYSIYLYSIGRLLWHSSSCIWQARHLLVLSFSCSMQASPSVLCGPGAGVADNYYHAREDSHLCLHTHR